jgi:DNA-binding MarR family transcriptional regulator
MVINKDNYIGVYNMTTEKIKRMLDACYQAKRIRELLPPLPQGVTPSYIQYLDNIHALEKQGIQIKISDISDVMNLPRPGVTRTVKEMETKGYLRKISSPDDGRVTYISITEEGRKLSQKYNEYYFGELVPYLSEISEEEADCMIRTIEKFYQIMCERRNHYDK